MLTLRAVGGALAIALLATPPGCAVAPAAPSVAVSWPSGPAPSWQWQWQLTGELDVTVKADVFTVDAFTTTADEVERLHRGRRRVICHLSAGAYEESRPDRGRFPGSVLGAPTGRAGGRWLDIRQWSVLEPILRDRLRLCHGKGFDAVELADVDGYTKRSGFRLTSDDQLTFNRRVAQLAREVGLSPGLRNDLDQVVALEPDFDFAVNEECFRQRGCERLRPFVVAGKPVFHVEYAVPARDFCATVLGLGFTSMRKRPELDAWREPCRRV